MAYTNSSLVSYTKLSPNNSGTRTHSIDRITPHCVVGQCSVETLGTIFGRASAQASSNYGIGADGRVGMYVPESNRSWCSSSNANDQRAVTIECASDATAPYAFKDVVYDRLIELCVDICKRNGKDRLIWLGDRDKTLAYAPKSGEMILTVHRWFENKSCPGDWLMARMDDLAAQVTAELQGYAAGWQRSSDGWWYRLIDGSYATGWTLIDAKWYWFNADGYMAEDTTLTIDGKVYRFDESGHPTELKEAPEMRYETLKDAPDYARQTLDKLVERGVLSGKAGAGEDLVIDLGEDAVRLLVILDRAGNFG